MTRVCVVGSGGREHALALALGATCDTVICCPGNPGLATFPGPLGAGLVCDPRAPEAVDADLFVIGPEVPLVEGLADRLRARGRRVVGPGAAGARLEGSKAWMKSVLGRAGVPTASWVVFEDAELALAHLRAGRGPWVIKTDGLAAGKGVLVTDSLEEAEADALGKLSGVSFGAAGRVLVIEEALAGPELSVLALCDGTRAVALPAARDAKRLGDGDAGPNTGGMGAFAPVPDAPPSLVEKVLEVAVEPTLAALRRQGVEYRGVLYVGLMLTQQGPKVLELNVRLGDPEAQVVLPLLADDVVELFAAAADGCLDRVATAPLVAARPAAAVCVVLAAAGYPADPRPGAIIGGVDEAASRAGVTVLQAGTVLDGTGRLVAAGGRVLDVVGVGADLGTARSAAYGGVACIEFPGAQWRHDIAVPAATGSEEVRT